jgi:glycine/D-amino acid oxidase-like deaminating enzyme
VSVTVRSQTVQPAEMHSRAGVVGLTTAVLLSRDPKYTVTVIAKHMPGDYDIEYTSPVAGANYLPYVHTPFGSQRQGHTMLQSFLSPLCSLLLSTLTNQYMLFVMRNFCFPSAAVV